MHPVSFFLICPLFRLFVFLTLIVFEIFSVSTKSFYLSCLLIFTCSLFGLTYFGYFLTFLTSKFLSFTSLSFLFPYTLYVCYIIYCSLSFLLQSIMCSRNCLIILTLVPSLCLVTFLFRVRYILLSYFLRIMTSFFYFSPFLNIYI
jgi:hypothetical protein